MGTGPRANTNRSIAGKVGLRLATCRALGDRVRVLDAFAGSGRTWNAVRRHYAGELEVTGIDRVAYAGAIRMDNRVALQTWPLEAFDVIDLDDYGMPTEQVELTAKAGYTGPLIWTCIGTTIGVVPHRLTASEGIPVEWHKLANVVLGGRSVPDLRSRWCNYLAGFGWLNHAVLADARPGSAALYGLSTSDDLPINEADIRAAIISLREEDSHTVG